MAKSHACPKCNRLLQPSGSLQVNDAAGRPAGAAAVYQCDECMREVDFCGERTEVALTFAVDKAGRVFDPADPDGVLRF